MEFKPTHTVISTGDKNGFYTLREAGHRKIYTSNGPEIIFCTYHITNLSTDREEALLKGRKISEQMCIPFKGKADFTLEEIERRNADQIAEDRAKYQSEVAEKTAENQAIFDQYISEGVFANGKHKGLTPAQVAEEQGDEDYVRWLADQCDDDYKIDDMKSEVQIGMLASRQIAADWVRDNPEQVSQFIGQIGDKVTVTAEVTGVKSFQTQYGTSTVWRFKDADENKIVTFSTAQKLYDYDVGDTITIRGTVKDHEYSQYEKKENNKVTVLKRPSVK